MQLTPEQALVADIKAWTNERLIGDDCAILPGQQLVSTDMLVEGTHFIRSISSLAEIGWKSVAVNLSDIAAMAGKPRYILVGLTLPSDLKRRDIDRLYFGMLDCAKEYRVRIVGGDLTSGPLLVISITVMGDVHKSGCLLRSGARVGDVVIVTGDFGASFAGLWLMRDYALNNTDIRSKYMHCRQAHLRPQPKLSEAWMLVEASNGRGALIDASDGLADALVQLARQSKCGIEIDLLCLPINEETSALSKLAAVDLFEWALYGGEDYQLVACISQQVWDNLRSLPDCPFTAIGKVVKEKGVRCNVGDKLGPVLDLARSFQQITVR